MGRSRQKKKKNNLQRCERRRNNQPPETLPAAGAEERERKDKAEISDGGGPTRFFGCYLLSSLSPRYKGHSYIGFTVNPKRRIRQHNGEITSGAYKTKRKRPWEMVFCIHGFPTQVAALQFEWAWQHPKESLAVREAASTFKTLGGLANKIKLALTMLTLPSWKSMDLTVSFFSTKYMNHTAGCPSLPRQMKLHFCSMDELPCYWRGDHPDGHDDEYDIDSNSNEDFDRLVDDRQVSSIDTERFTVQSANESIWTWDQGDLDGPLERESCTMVGDDTVEEDEQILQSPPTSVHTENKTKEISTQELIESLHGIDPSGKESSSHSFHQIDLSEKASASHPVLEEDMDLSRQFPAGGLSKEMWTEEQRDSSPLLEDLTEPFGQIKRSEGESSSMVIEMLAKKDDMTYVLIDESTNEQRYPTYEQLPVRVRGDAVWPSSMEGIEVIDLFTPSPECRVISGSKKRRVARDSTDIIDLTRSPLFVQLDRVGGDAVWPSSMEGIEVIDLFTPSPECRVVSGSKKRRVTRDSTDIIDLTRSPLFVQL